MAHCKLTCNFEVDTCQWKLSDGWMRSQGKASNLDTGPTDDRTNPGEIIVELYLLHPIFSQNKYHQQILNVH